MIFVTLLALFIFKHRKRIYFYHTNNEKVDLDIIPNNTVSNNLNINSIIIFLPRILMVFTNKKTDITDLKILLETGSVFFEDRSGLDSIFLAFYTEVKNDLNQALKDA